MGKGVHLQIILYLLQPDESIFIQSEKISSCGIKKNGGEKYFS